MISTAPHHCSTSVSPTGCAEGVGGGKRSASSFAICSTPIHGSRESRRRHATTTWRCAGSCSTTVSSRRRTTEGRGRWRVVRRGIPSPTDCSGRTSRPAGPHRWCGTTSRCNFPPQRPRPGSGSTPESRRSHGSLALRSYACAVAQAFARKTSIPAGKTSGRREDWQATRRPAHHKKASISTRGSYLPHLPCWFACLTVIRLRCSASIRPQDKRSRRQGKQTPGRQADDRKAGVPAGETGGRREGWRTCDGVRVNTVRTNAPAK